MDRAFRELLQEKGNHQNCGQNSPPIWEFVCRKLAYLSCCFDEYKQVDALSRINHKNFVNLLGFCEEEEPFTRMMVLEYAPNGTLHESLHGRRNRSSSC